MGLRSRLAIFFMVITVVPVTVAVGVVQARISAQELDRAEQELVRSGSLVAALIDAERLRAGDLATDLASREGIGAALQDAAAAQRWLADQPVDGRADVVVLASRDGRALAHRGTAATGTEGEGVARRAAAVAADPGAPTGDLLLEVRVVRPVGLVATGIRLDAGLLARVVDQPPAGSGAALFAGDAEVASTGRGPAPRQLPEPGRVGRDEVSGDPVLAGVTALPAAGAALVLWTPVPAGPVLGVIVAAAVVAVLAGAALGSVLAGSVVASVRRAADVARAVAGGDLSRKLPRSGGRELADLADALNAMSDELAARLAEIEGSRDELRQSLVRLGDALSGTLDLDHVLNVVVETAERTLRADGAVVLLLDPARSTLEARAARGSCSRAPLRATAGVVGHVVRSGLPLRLPGAGSPPRAAEEPSAPYLLIVPLRARDTTNGVLLLERGDGRGPFDDDALRTAGSIAAGVAVAVENIRLHEEAHRLSLTSPVTGLWNNRYFEPQADAELDRARRVNERDGARREVSVLAIDLDRFGRINKEYDQAAGDAALVEVGARLQDVIRSPDVVTHPHGEEFAVLLPDTGYEGALLVADRLRAAVSQAPVTVPQGSQTVDLDLTCSVGVATFPHHASDRAGLYRAADLAMQLAKDRGRDRVVGAAELPGD